MLKFNSHKVMEDYLYRQEIVCTNTSILWFCYEGQGDNEFLFIIFPIRFLFTTVEDNGMSLRNDILL